jgi:DNA-binding NtrC family response regulator
MTTRDRRPNLRLVDTSPAPGSVAVPAGGPAPTHPAPPGSTVQRVALVVDDEATIGVLVARLLHANGWRAIVTTEPDDAAAIAREVELDLLVTNLEMPGLSGVDLTTRLRERRSTLPVVLMSDRPHALDVELDPPFIVVPKPFHHEGILGAVRSLFGDPVGGAGAAVAQPS